MHHDRISDTERVSICSLLMFADVKSEAILKPNDFMAFGLLSYRSMISCEICGANVTLKVGFDGLAASLIAYCRASFYLRKYNDGCSAST